MVFRSWVSSRLGLSSSQPTSRFGLGREPTGPSQAERGWARGGAGRPGGLPARPAQARRSPGAPLCPFRPSLWVLRRCSRPARGAPPPGPPPLPAPPCRGTRCTARPPPRRRRRRRRPRPPGSSSVRSGCRPRARPRRAPSCAAQRRASARSPIHADVRRSLPRRPSPSRAGRARPAARPRPEALPALHAHHVRLGGRARCELGPGALAPCSHGCGRRRPRPARPPQ